MEKNKLQHVTTDKLVSDIRSIIEQGRQQAKFGLLSPILFVFQ
ncbi:MAG: hypothetical protein ACI3ZD_02385 [Prevotella sp.]